MKLKLKKILDQISDGILLMKEKKLLFTNQRFKELFQILDYSQMQIEVEIQSIFEKIEDVNSEPRYLSETNLQKLNNSAIFKTQNSTLWNFVSQKLNKTAAKLSDLAIFKTNSDKKIRIKSKTVLLNEGEAFLFVFEDITFEKDLENEQLQSKYQKMMLATTSHELKTPLNGNICSTSHHI
jgi:hypothetical protein